MHFLISDSRETEVFSSVDKILLSYKGREIQLGYFK